MRHAPSLLRMGTIVGTTISMGLEAGLLTATGDQKVVWWGMPGTIGGFRERRIPSQLPLGVKELG